VWLAVPKKDNPQVDWGGDYDHYQMDLIAPFTWEGEVEVDPDYGARFFFRHYKIERETWEGSKGKNIGSTMVKWIQRSLEQSGHWRGEESDRGQISMASIAEEYRPMQLNACCRWQPLDEYTVQDFCKVSGRKVCKVHFNDLTLQIKVMNPLTHRKWIRHIMISLGMICICCCGCFLGNFILKKQHERKSQQSEVVARRRSLLASEQSMMQSIPRGPSTPGMELQGVNEAEEGNATSSSGLQDLTLEGAVRY